MTDRLSRWQAIVLGLVVLTAVALGGVGLVAVAAKQGYWRESFTLTVGFPEVHDVKPGTPVRIRGIDAGQVTNLQYPDGNGPIVVELELDTQYRNKLFADARAQIQPTGLLGAKIIAIQPGDAEQGLLVGTSIPAVPTTDLTRLAAEGEATLKDVRVLIGDVRQAIKKVDGAVDTEMKTVRTLMEDSRDAVQSVRQNSEAVSRLPIVRNYVESAAVLLVRPDYRHDELTYNTNSLFEPGTAILTEEGRGRLQEVAAWVKGQAHPKMEVVVAAASDPADTMASTSVVEQLTRKQAEVAVEFLKAHGAHKMGWWTRRKITPLGLGKGGSPIQDSGPPPPNFVQIVIFTPQ